MMYSLYIILFFWRSGPALQYGVSVTEMLKKNLNQTYKLSMLNSIIHDVFYECRLKIFYQEHCENEDSRMKTTEIRRKEETEKKQRTAQNYQAV